MKISRFATLLLLVLTAVAAVAQNGTMTPYSAYGLGVLRDGATSTQRSMGGVGYAMVSGRQINPMNPASYAAIDSLTFLFNLGIDLNNMWQKETYGDGTKGSNKQFGGGLDYATIQVPLGRYMGASVGLVPYSTVGYAFGNTIENGIDSRQGSGSINEFYLGVAGRPFRGFTVGANISYLFGTILNETYAQISGSTSALFQKQLVVRDYHLTFGVQYSLRTRGSDMMTLGLVYSPAKTLLGRARQVYYDTDQDSKPQFSDDHTLKGNYSLPETWGAGISYTFDRSFTAEFDYTYQPWSKAKFRGYEGDVSLQQYVDRSKYALGFQWVPDFRGSYFRRAAYRLGTYFNDDYLKIRGNRLREYGVSAGIGFPVPQFKTTVNLGVEWKHRQAHPDPMIKENYVTVTIGVNFNEMWFRQSKIY